MIDTIRNIVNTDDKNEDIDKFLKYLRKNKGDFILDLRKDIYSNGSLNVGSLIFNEQKVKIYRPELDGNTAFEQQVWVRTRPYGSSSSAKCWKRLADVSPSLASMSSRYAADRDLQIYLVEKNIKLFPDRLRDVELIVERFIEKTWKEFLEFASYEKAAKGN